MCGLSISEDLVEGEARAVGREHARMAMEIAAGEHPPTLIISGGECTVTIAGTGKGGPNTEYLMGMALELGGAPGIHALACDTDGIDGAMDNAGAMIDPGHTGAGPCGRSRTPRPCSRTTMRTPIF